MNQKTRLLAAGVVLCATSLAFSQTPAGKDWLFRPSGSRAPSVGELKSQRIKRETSRVAYIKSQEEVGAYVDSLPNGYANWSPAQKLGHQRRVAWANSARAEMLYDFGNLNSDLRRKTLQCIQDSAPSGNSVPKKSIARCVKKWAM